MQLSSHQHWWIFPATIGQWKVRPYPLPNYNYNFSFGNEKEKHIPLIVNYFNEECQ
jgi:hypothetical protein